jgi:hypothetical protein
MALCEVEAAPVGLAGRGLEAVGGSGRQECPLRVETSVFSGAWSRWEPCPSL